MKCPNCFCTIADSIGTCPCCGYVFEKTPEIDSAYNTFSRFSAENQKSNYIQTDGHFSVNSKSHKDSLKINIIIALLAIDILVGVLELILK